VCVCVYNEELLICNLP